MVAEVVRWRWTEVDGFWEAKRGRYEGRGDGRMISGRKESATAGGGFCWLGTLGVTWGVWDPLRLHMLSTTGPPGDQDVEQEMRAGPASGKSPYANGSPTRLATDG